MFAGGWTLEASEAVGSGEDIEETEVVDLLSGLVEKSLVVAESTQQGGVRYRLLEPVRQYALEKLEQSGEAEDIKRSHAGYFLALAEEAELWLSGPRQAEWFERLEEEHDNIRAALSWARAHGEAELSLGLAGALGGSGSGGTLRRGARVARRGAGPGSSHVHAGASEGACGGEFGGVGAKRPRQGEGGSRGGAKAQQGGRDRGRPDNFLARRNLQSRLPEPTGRILC